MLADQRVLVAVVACDVDCFALTDFIALAVEAVEIDRVTVRPGRV